MRLGVVHAMVAMERPTTGVIVSRIAALVVACAGLSVVGAPAGAGVGESGAGVQPVVGSAEASRESAREWGREWARAIAAFGGEKAFTRPSQDAVMGFATPTTIREVLVRGGQTVKRGDLLVRGDDAEELALLEAQVLRADSALPIDRAEKAVELQRFEYDQLLNLEREGGGSAQELERARLSLAAAVIDFETAKFNQDQERAQIKRIQARVDRFRIVAPFDGEVDTVFMDLGQSVSDSDQVLRLVDIDPLEIDVPVPTQQTLADPSAGRKGILLGEPAWVVMELPGELRVFVGRVTEVSPVADSRSNTRRVRVEVPNPERLVAGLTAYVRFTEPEGEWKERVVGEGGQIANGK